MYLLLLPPQPNAATASIAAERPINRLRIPSSTRNQAELNTLGPQSYRQHVGAVEALSGSDCATLFMHTLPNCASSAHRCLALAPKRRVRLSRLRRRLPPRSVCSARPFRRATREPISPLVFPRQSPTPRATDR